MAEDDGFLGRWSRRKQEARQEREKAATAEAERHSEADATAEPAGPGAPKGSEPEPEPELPDPDALGRDDDWSVYLRAGVPEVLKRRALQRLWRLDPVFANLDGLNDYDEDFNRPELKRTVVKTLFKVGRGMVLPEDEKKQAARREPAAEPEGETRAEDPAALPGKAEDAPADSRLAETPSPAAEAAGGEVPRAGREAGPAGQPSKRAAARRWGRFAPGERGGAGGKQ